MKKVYAVYDIGAVDVIDDIECLCATETEADAQEMILDLTMEDVYFQFVRRLQRPEISRFADVGWGRRQETDEEIIAIFTKSNGHHNYIYQSIQIL